MTYQDPARVVGANGLTDAQTAAGCTVWTGDDLPDLENMAEELVHGDAPWCAVIYERGDNANQERGELRLWAGPAAREDELHDHARAWGEGYDWTVCQYDTATPDADA